MFTNFILSLKFKTFSETMESSRDVVNLSKRIITNMAVPSGSKDDDELVEGDEATSEATSEAEAKPEANEISKEE